MASFTNATPIGTPDRSKPKTSNNSPKKGKKEVWELRSSLPIATFTKKFKPDTYWNQAYGKLGPSELQQLQPSFPMDIPIPSRQGNTDGWKQLGKGILEPIYETWKYWLMQKPYMLQGIRLEHRLLDSLPEDTWQV